MQTLLTGHDGPLPIDTPLGPVERDLALLQPWHLALIAEVVDDLVAPV